MDRKDAIKLVEELLDLYANRNFATIHEVMLHQRGYLTGILADIIRDDLYAEHLIKKKIAQAKKKWLASPEGFEPSPAVLETDMLPLTPGRYVLFITI